MKDLWKELNDKIPKYFEYIITKYHLNAIKLNHLSTALVCDKYALVIGIGRFEAVIEYISYNKDGILVKYITDNFFSEKFDETDRQNLIVGNGAQQTIINNLLVISQGMESEWRKVLEGDKEWIKSFEKSKWFEIVALREYEYHLKELIHNNITK